MCLLFSTISIFLINLTLYIIINLNYYIIKKICIFYYTIRRLPTLYFRTPPNSIGVCKLLFGIC